MKVSVDIIENSNDISELIQCVVELPEKDRITGRDYIVFREEMAVVPSKYITKWDLYEYKSKVINTLFDRICMNIIQFNKYGIK